MFTKAEKPIPGLLFIRLGSFSNTTLSKFVFELQPCRADCEAK